MSLVTETGGSDTPDFDPDRGSGVPAGLENNPIETEEDSASFSSRLARFRFWERGAKQDSETDITIDLQQEGEAEEIEVRRAEEPGSEALDQEQPLIQKMPRIKHHHTVGDAPPEAAIEDIALVGEPHFQRMSQPYILPGNEPTVIIYGGLSSTGRPWWEFADEINTELGLRVEVYSLKGHDGTKKALLETTYLDWINDIREKIEGARERGIRPIFIGASTSAVAGMEAIIEEQELDHGKAFVAGCAMMGPPYELMQKTHSRGLKVVDAIAKAFPRTEGLLRKITWPPFDFMIKDKRTPVQKVKNPKIQRMPIHALRQLYLMIPDNEEEKQAKLSQYKGPFLMLHGDHDVLVSRESVQDTFDRIGTAEEKKKHLYLDAPHSVPFATREERERLADELLDWISDIVDNEPIELTPEEEKVSIGRKARRLVHRFGELGKKLGGVFSRGSSDDDPETS